MSIPAAETSPPQVPTHADLFLAFLKVAASGFGGALPWDLLLSGAALGAVGILAGLPALPFALGVYLPLSTMAAVFLGGVVRRLGDAGSAGKEAGASSGILCASGFVAGEGLAGVLIAGYAYFAGKKGGGGEASGLTTFPS